MLAPEEPLVVRDVFALAREEGITLEVNDEWSKVKATPSAKMSDSLRLAIKGNRRRLFKSLVMAKGAKWLADELGNKGQRNSGVAHDATYRKCSEDSPHLLRYLEDDVPEEKFLDAYRAFLSDVVGEMRVASGKRAA